MESELKIYYANVFPAEAIYRWLLETPNREFSLTFKNNIYARCQSYASSDILKNVLIEKTPEKLDIGAIYSSKPTIGTEHICIQKELVFDIDLTDYHRNCCTGKSICDLCFTLVKIAAKIMNFFLTKKLGFSRILYVFSGGRGLHVWVSDMEARFLDNIERRGLVEYINLSKIFSAKKTSNKNPNEYPNNTRTLNNSKISLLDPIIVDILRSYGYFFKDQGLNEEQTLENLIKYLYVKLDVNVTNDIKHLLKCPFSVHQSTKKVSIPIPLEMFDSIKVSDIPDLETVLRDASSLKPFIDHFTEFSYKISNSK